MFIDLTYVKREEENNERDGEGGEEVEEEKSGCEKNRVVTPKQRVSYPVFCCIGNHCRNYYIMELKKVICQCLCFIMKECICCAGNIIASVGK